MKEFLEMQSVQPDFDNRILDVILTFSYEPSFTENGNEIIREMFESFEHIHTMKTSTSKKLVKKIG